jgi:hypothetical protein
MTLTNIIPPLSNPNTVITKPLQISLPTFHCPGFHHSISTLQISCLNYSTGIRILGRRIWKGRSSLLLVVAIVLDPDDIASGINGFSRFSAAIRTAETVRVTTRNASKVLESISTVFVG